MPDVYAGLLSSRQRLTAPQVEAWQNWIGGLRWYQRESTLFELDTLLKGIACFGNPRNHTGPARPADMTRANYCHHLRILRDSLHQCSELAKQLLGKRERIVSYSRHLESALPSEQERTRNLRESLDEEDPEVSLVMLRSGLTHLLDISDGLLESGFITLRLYEAVRALVSRELSHSVFFSPVLALEFTPEHARIPHPELLDVLAAMSQDARHRLTALTFLTLLRARRYVRFIESVATYASDLRLAFPILAALRSDVRALTTHVGSRSADLLADDFEGQVLAVPAAEMSGRFQELVGEGARLVSLRVTFDNLTNSLSLEFRRAFSEQLPAPDDIAQPEAQIAPLKEACNVLRDALEHALRQLYSELAPGANTPVFEDNEEARRMRSERLRREIWMFMQVLRAFVAKAEAGTDQSDRWGNTSDLDFVQDFLSHFRAIGLQLIRLADYERIEWFLDALDALRDRDAGQRAALDKILGESRVFLEHLQSLFDEVSKRQELAEVPFDRRAAVQALKLYLHVT